MIETSPSLRVWQVELGNRADLAFMLRDFLRRNDIEADVSGPAAVALTTRLRRGDVLQLLGLWETVTGVVARLDGEPKLLADADRTAAPSRPRLGELLVAKGFLTEEQLALALNEARETGELLGVLLVNKRVIFEDELARTLSQQLSVPYISVMRVGVSPAALNLMPVDEGKRVAAIPVRIDSGEVQVAFADPTDREALDVVHRYISSVRIAVSELSDIRMAWRQAEPVAAR
jgi:Type II secretion system (T2SS), protein E, N-terminal domain